MQKKKSFYQEISCDSLTPLDRVFKIHKNVLHEL